MAIFAAFDFAPGTIALWLFIGLGAGWVAGKIMENASYGGIGDMCLGVFGALTGAFVYALVWGGYWASFLVAFIGAAVIIGVGRAVAAIRNA